MEELSDSEFDKLVDSTTWAMWEALKAAPSGQDLPVYDLVGLSVNASLNVLAMVAVFAEKHDVRTKDGRSYADWLIQQVPQLFTDAVKAARGKQFDDLGRH